MSVLIMYVYLGQNIRSKDVLELIAKMLSFSDDQKAAIGLGPTSLIASLLGTVVGKPAPPVDIEVRLYFALYIYRLLLFLLHYTLISFVFSLSYIITG